MTDAKIIHEDAVRERYQARDRAGRKLADDIRFAHRQYELALADAERVYRLRTESHPLTGE